MPIRDRWPESTGNKRLPGPPGFVRMIWFPGSAWF